MPWRIFKRGVAVGQPRSFNGGVMKTAFKLFLLSASFLSANVFAESTWMKSPGQPGMEPPYEVSAMAMSPDGQIILITERRPTVLMIWRSTDAGKTWYYLHSDLGGTRK